MPSKSIVAIIAILILLTIALVNHINGAALSTGVAVIAGLGGYQVGRKVKNKKAKD